MKPYITSFNIRILRKGTLDDLFSTKGTPILDVLADTRLFSRKILQVCADPFLFVDGNKLYLFYEKQYQQKGKGYIAMRYTENLTNWSEEVTVLKEPFHLSFPFVFKDEGSYYLIPESNQAKSIRLYQATDSSLTNWKNVGSLIEEKNNWVDSSVISIDGIYYLFTTTTNKNDIQSQRLFYSRRLKEGYVEHPCSPIYTGNDYGRNAGSIMCIDGNYYRPTQDCKDYYGKQVHILKIDEISQHRYCEHVEKQNIIDVKIPFYKRGGHQFNCVKFRGEYIISTDAKVRNYNLFELVERILRRI